MLEQELCVAQEELDCMARNGQIFFKNRNLNNIEEKKLKMGKRENMRWVLSQVRFHAKYHINYIIIILEE